MERKTRFELATLSLAERCPHRGHTGVPIHRHRYLGG